MLSPSPTPSSNSSSSPSAIASATDPTAFQLSQSLHAVSCLAFFAGHFGSIVLVDNVVTIAIAVLFNYNYLFNHNFVRVSTIINHQMQCRQRPAEFCDWANCQPDRLPAFSERADAAEQEAGEGDGKQEDDGEVAGQAKWNVLHASTMWQHGLLPVRCSSCSAQKVASAAERYNYLVSSQSVNRLVELATGAPASAIAVATANTTFAPLLPSQSHKSIDHVL